MPLDPVLDLLVCPLCRSRLSRTATALACPTGHSFDVARQRYVNLLGAAQPVNADSVAMVAARERFLGTGAYDPFVDALDAALDTTLDTTLDPRPDEAVLVDAGAGPGWYLAALLDRHPAARGLAVDVAVAAARRAARRNPRLGAVVADAWSTLPVADAAADVVLSVFAPRNPADAARLLRPGGRYLVLAAEPDHLVELRERYGLLGVEPDKQQRLERALDERFVVLSSDRVSTELTLAPDAVADLVAMGPNAFHSSPPVPSGPVTVTAAVRLTIARLRPDQD